MSDDIYKVCCIIDFDGFGFRNYSANGTFKNEFLIREIGFIKIDPEMGDFLAKSFRFDLTFFDFTHCKDAWNTINRQSRHINGLSFRPQHGEAVYPYSQVRTCVEKIYDMCRIPERDIVAYKGGQYEKKILDELQIRNLDLGHYLCPSFENIVTRNMFFSPLINCGYHNRMDDRSLRIVHCPRTEVTAFKDWLFFHYPFRSGQADGIGHSCGFIAESSPQLSRAASSSGLSFS